MAASAILEPVIPQLNREQRRELERAEAVVSRYKPHPSNGGVVIAYCDDGRPYGEFMHSVTGLLMVDSMNEQRVTGQRSLGRGGVIRLESGPRVAVARNDMVLAFLTDENFVGADYLLMLDSDMSFEPDLMERLIATSEKQDADVCGALCFGGGHSDRIFPTIYKVTNEAGIEVQPVDDELMVMSGKPVKCGATGAAGILIRRRVLVALMRAYGMLPPATEDGDPIRNPSPWFVEGHLTNEGKPLGEDIAFCIRVNAIGGSVWVDTSVQMGHVKKQQLNLDLWLERRAKAAQAAEPAPSVEELEQELAGMVRNQ